MLKKAISGAAATSPAILVALAAVSSWLIFDPVLTGSLDPAGFFQHLARGELLWHGLPGFDSYEMPLPVIYLMPFWHLSAGLIWLSQFLLVLLIYAEVVFIGERTGPAGAGRLAGSLLLCAVIAAQCWSAIAGRMDFWRYLETAWFTLSCLSVVAALDLYSEKPGLRTACLLGCAIGASFLVRSTLFLLPVVLFACLLIAAGDRGERRRLLLPGLVLGLSACAFLVPWIWMNYGLGNGFVPFESGRADCNIISGAHGFIETLDADGLTAGGVLAPEAGKTSAAAYYLRYVAAHKLDFAAGVALRFVRFLTFQPVYLALFIAAAFKARLWRAGRGCCCFIAYFIGIHLLFPVEERYFMPLYAVMLPVIAGLAPAGALRAAAGPGPRKYHALALGAILLFAGLSQWAVLSYPGRSAEKAGPRATGAQSNDFWKRYLYATSAMAAAPEKAAQTLGELYAVFPVQEILARLLIAQSLAGRLEPGLLEKLPNTEVRAAAAKTLILLYAGKDEDAFSVRKKFFSRGEKFCASSFSSSEKARCAAYAESLRALARQRLDAETVEATAHFPARARRRMLRKLSLLGGESLRSLALIFQEEGAYGEAREMLDGLIRERPDDPDLLSDRAVQSIFLGDCGPAGEDLRKALKLDPGNRNARMNYDYLRSGSPACIKN